MKDRNPFTTGEAHGSFQAGHKRLGHTGDRLISRSFWQIHSKEWRVDVDMGFRTNGVVPKAAMQLGESINVCTCFRLWYLWTPFEHDIYSKLLLSAIFSVRQPFMKNVSQTTVDTRVSLQLQKRWNSPMISAWERSGKSWNCTHCWWNKFDKKTLLLECLHHEYLSLQCHWRKKKSIFDALY